MGYKDDLLRIGKDGFAIIEEHMEKKNCQIWSPKKKPYAPQRPTTVEAKQPSLYQYRPKQTRVYQVKPLAENEIMRMNKYEAVDFRGVSIMDYSKRSSDTIFY
ncbi:high osmolarity signaling protein SHO1 [Striga asiatica]|uniref:High osmolarity signaling protein SHO1 n=1 Tax=Striga asiatica TaxID=4170 RepID=A0A5A7R388_STRAF|nr:high osmolarity signaling protein SHO1 [Striga asiatica]